MAKSSKSKSEPITEYRHPCIQCSRPYRDLEPDPYLCANCKDDRKGLEKTLEKSRKSNPKETFSELAMIPELSHAPKKNGQFWIRNPYA